MKSILTSNSFELSERKVTRPARAAETDAPLPSRPDDHDGHSSTASRRDGPGFTTLRRLLSLLVLALGWFGFAAPQLHAQATNDVEELKRQLQQVREELTRSEREHRQQIEALSRKLDGLLNQTTGIAGGKPAETPTVSAPANAAAPLGESKPWQPTAPIRVGGSGAYVDVSMVATFAAGGSTASDIEGGTQLGGHDPNQRGFTVQGAELNLQGAIDPYFRGNANIVFQLDSGSESFVELEEAWLESVALPGNLQIRAGQYLTEFGRINTQHPHTWGFVDAPLVSGRLLGEDGIRNPGARLSWLVPTPFYSELFFGIQNSQGGTAASFRNDHGGSAFLGRLDTVDRVKGFGDLLYSVRYAASFDVTDTQTMLAGASAVFGPNSSGADTATQIYGVDLYWKWKPANAHGGFPFVAWQTEAMLRRYRAGAFTEDSNGNGVVDLGEPDLNGDGLVDSAPREMLTDWGMYSQLLYGFRPGWVAGLRGDFVTATKLGAYEAVYGVDPERATRWRISPNLTWYPSEFSKVRLQYNYDDRDTIGTDHSVWLQFEFLLGAHAAHKF